MNRLLLLAPILIFLSSCSMAEIKDEIKTELKTEFNNEKFELAIVDDSLLGVNKFEVDQDYGCTFSGNFKFNVKVPQGFTGFIQDPEATYLIKGKEIKMDYYSTFVDGSQIIGTSIYEYVRSDEKLTKEGLLFCAVDSTDDIKLKAFSEKVIVIKGIKPNIN